MFGVGVRVESSLGLLRIIIFFLLLVGDLKEDLDRAIDNTSDQDLYDMYIK